MQLKVLVLTAIAAVAAAAPSAEGDWKHGCEPGTYDCREHGEPGWRVCDTNGKWRLGGLCPPKTDCFWSEENDVPYCIPAHHFDWP